MREEIAARLLQINKEFYQRFGPAFAETRRRLQPGVRLAVQELPPEASVLDVGCGSGEVARALARRRHRGPYLGLDWSARLLMHAQDGPLPPGAIFEVIDLSLPGWALQLPGPYDRILAFAVLHHLPGHERRLGFARQASNLLAADGRMVVSVWNFLASPRLRARLVDWAVVGLRPEEVDAGDYLLDWRHGGHGLRYVHHFSAEELGSLAKQAGLAVRRQYFSDGESGQLGLYQEWALP
ncbi:MAG: class I SAM-dependent methyltransferase [Chloroflexota bacterium]